MKYANNNEADAFLQQLAEGGFQVGELAKDYFPGGTQIPSLKHQAAATATLQLLQQENAIIYEAAFLWQNCYVLVDVLVKNGNHFELIEVKAKSYHPKEDNFFDKRGENLTGNWEPYLYDVAFQQYVVNNSLAENGLKNYTVSPYLMLADKSVVATVTGLNQLYQLAAVDKDNDRKQVVKNKDATLYTAQNLGHQILVKIDVENEVKYIQQFGKVGSLDFEKGITAYSQALLKLQDDDLFKGTILKKTCKKCEFSAPNNNSLSGLQECLKLYKSFRTTDFEKPLVWHIAGFNAAARVIAEGKFFMDQLTREDFVPQSGDKAAEKGMSGVDRKEHQLTTTLAQSTAPIVCKDHLKLEMATWKFPLHFIDFEGSRTALPFYKNMKPYEQIAFQFSHHIVHENGTIEHATEWLNMEQGYFPNFDFLRALKVALSNDDGTVFKYSSYENTTLNQIEIQLKKSAEAYKQTLIDFIHTITYKKAEREAGNRNMVDLCDVVKKYYYNPLTNGSNSIKFVLPAILNTSTHLQEKYSHPIYGSTSMSSKNFTNQIWIQKDENGKVKDPYKLLKNVYQEKIDIVLDTEDFEFEDKDAVANGGAAMAAYNEIQFTTTTQERRDELKQELLRYCELDTLAMVIVYEELVQSIRIDITL
jgi:hypothetical protein